MYLTSLSRICPPQSGELIEELGKVGIKSALVTETEEK